MDRVMGLVTVVWRRRWGLAVRVVGTVGTVGAVKGWGRVRVGMGPGRAGREGREGWVAATGGWGVS